MAIHIGIDLGTTNTVVAAVVDGHPVIVKTSESLQHIPSVVCDDTLVTQSVLVGDLARSMIASQPENTAYSVKRLMGMRYYDRREPRKGENESEREKFLRIADRVSYGLAPDPQGRDDGVRVVLAKDKYYLPEEISALILGRAKKEAENFFHTEVASAVITVPAYFEPKQVEATKRAGQLAGLNVSHILDEPSAAAISVGMKNQRDNRHVLVYDLGGGTFDVSLLQVHRDRFNVKNKGGDNFLGGDDFDYLIVKRMADYLAREQLAGHNPFSEPAFRSWAKPLAEEAKITLSKSDFAVINATNPCTILPAPDGRSARLVTIHNLHITRAEFEEQIGDHLNRTLHIVEQVLNEVNILSDHIDEVLLVGGSTYIPRVRRAMEDQFPRSVLPVEDVHPMHCVAEGAAIYANEMAKRDQQAGRPVTSAGGFEVKNITERSIGIAALVGDKSDVYRVIVPKSTRIPMDRPAERVFTAVRPDRVLVPVYAGANPDSAVASRNILQGNIELELQSAPVDVGTPVTVGLRLRDDRTIEVRVRVQGREEVVKDLVFLQDATDDEWEDELEKSIHIGETFLAEYEPYLADGQAERLRKHLQLGSEALEKRARREGTLRQKRIIHEVYYTDTLGSLLFQADQLKLMSTVHEAARDRIGDLCEAAKDAFHEHKQLPSAETQIACKEVEKRLEVIINLIWRQLHDQNDRGPGGEVRDTSTHARLGD